MGQTQPTESAPTGGTRSRLKGFYVLDSSDFEVHREQVGPLTVRVIHDDSGAHESPRTWDRGNVFMTAHRSYNSPDKYRGEFWDALAEAFDVRGRRDCLDYSTDQAAILRAIDRDSVWLWVFIYDHSGVTYQAAASNPFSCRWDSGRVGIIYRKKDAIRAERGPRITAAIRASELADLKNDVETYSAWASGDVYSYQVEDKHGTTLDSCYGFIGADSAYALTAGVEAAESMLRRANEQRAASLKNLIRARAPLARREALLRNAFNLVLRAGN